MSILGKFPLTVILSFCALLATAVGGRADEASAERQTLRPRVLALRGNPAADVLVQAAKAVVYDGAKPLMVRHDRYERLGEDRSWIDPRAKRLGGEQREVFALAMSDYHQANIAAGELPLLAAAWVLSSDADIGRRLVAQLGEMRRWSPMQRMGWTAFEPGAALPVNDGNSWLATGMGVRAIADALEILGDDPLIADVRPGLVELLRKEIDLVVGDWNAKRPWFVQSRNTRTNQWMLPTEGLVRACLVVGPKTVPAAYELGVANFFAALDGFGPNGEFDEGVAYATMTVQSAFSLARAMAAAGDPRGLRHPFVARHAAWYVQHFQPARHVINAFDCVGVSVARRDDRDYREHLALLALTSGSPEALWAQRTLFDPADARSVTALLADAMMLPEGYAGPAPYAAYERATRVNWRSSWADDATGLWARGGHRQDFHDHTDRGHVNFFLRGRPVFIEQGMVHYGDDDYKKYSGPGGHNLLTLEGRNVVSAPAPITVRRLDAQGGDVTISPTAAYRRLEKWDRHLRWDEAGLDVKDEVKVRDDRVDGMSFRWHTGAPSPVRLSGEGNSWRAEWDGVVLTVEASHPVTVTQAMSTNATLLDKKWQSERPQNVLLTVTSVEKLNAFTLTTSVRAADAVVAPTMTDDTQSGPVR